MNRCTKLSSMDNVVRLQAPQGIFLAFSEHMLNTLLSLCNKYRYLCQKINHYLKLGAKYPIHHDIGMNNDGIYLM